jgi:hypothetical protein
MGSAPYRCVISAKWKPTPQIKTPKPYAALVEPHKGPVIGVGTTGDVNGLVYGGDELENMFSASKPQGQSAACTYACCKDAPIARVQGAAGEAASESAQCAGYNGQRGEDDGNSDDSAL